MPLETLDRTPPPFFKQGPSALSRLLFFSALALFFMVADGRFHVMQPLRASISVALYSAQWLTLQPVRWARSAGDYFTNLSDARKDEADARALLIEQARRSGQVEALQAENQRLRALLNLRQRVNATKTTTAEALYDATDPYTRQVVIDKGQAQGIQAGSPVIDETGVIGQVTRVYPFVSEVTLLVDRNQTIPVLNPRTGLRSITYGDPTLRGGALELRYVSTAEDVRVGDLLTTSGIDGVYPPGLPVARVLSVERPADASFARILCQPLAHLSGVTQVMVLAPVEQPSSIPPDMIGPHLSPQAQLPNEVSASAAVVAASAAVSATAAASATAAPVSSAPPRASVSATSVVGVTRTVREHSPRARVHLAPNVSRASASSRASTSANPGVSPNLNSANSSPPALDASADTGDSP